MEFSIFSLRASIIFINLFLQIVFLYFSCVGIFRSCYIVSLGSGGATLPFLLAFPNLFEKIIVLSVDSCIVFLDGCFCSFIICFIYCLLAQMAKNSGDWQIFRYSRVASAVVCGGLGG